MREPRYFVRVISPSIQSHHKLRELGLDLFRTTARRSKGEASIGGLLTMKEIEQLVRAGYRVLVEEDAERRAHGARQVIGFDQWLREMEGK